MILRWSSSHARSHSSAPIKTTKMMLPSYKKNNPSFAFVFLRLCRGKNKQQQQSNEDPFQSLSLITSTFSQEKVLCLGFLAFLNPNG